MIKVFIADFLPLANKGEEEIIRGIETLFQAKTSENIEFRVFGNVDSKTTVGNVTIYPRSICYPISILTGKKKIIYDLYLAIKGCLGFYPYNKGLESYSGLIQDIKECDKVLIGHDGFFNLRCSLLGMYFKKHQIRYSILGAGFNRPGKKIAWIYDKVYKKCFDGAEYIILREKTAYDYVREISSNKIVELLPDPAFFCPSDKYNFDTLSKLVPKYSLDNNSIKVGITICENSISFSTAFRGSSNKVHDHRTLIANILNEIGKKYKCCFYFLPHCIEQGAGNDLVIAKDIVTRMNPDVTTYIIEEDIPVLDIKNIISRMDFMIGERTHSIINSISTETPFVNLTCTADFRTHDIVGKGCGLEHLIYDLDSPDYDKLLDLISTNIENRNSVKEEMHKVYVKNLSNKESFINII